MEPKEIGSYMAVRTFLILITIATLVYLSRREPQRGLFSGSEVEDGPGTYYGGQLSFTQELGHESSLAIMPLSCPPWLLEPHRHACAFMASLEDAALYALRITLSTPSSSVAAVELLTPDAAGFRTLALCRRAVPARWILWWARPIEVDCFRQWREDALAPVVAVRVTLTVGGARGTISIRRVGKGWFWWWVWGAVAAVGVGALLTCACASCAFVWWWRRRREGGAGAIKQFSTC
jgi:hypothetical protein